VLATVPEHHFGSGSRSKPDHSTLAVWVVDKPKLPTRVRFHGKFPTHPNWVGCQWVVQWVHLSIHIRLLYLQCDNSILSKSSFQQPIKRFCLLSSLQYRIIWYLCFTFDIWYFCLARWSIIMLLS
jgi:hypothetical protein